MPRTLGVPSSPTAAVTPWNNSLGKRVFDLLLSIVLLVLLSPVLIAVAFMVKVTSKGPVLFRQQRVGKGGRPFWVFKFRTMIQDSDRAGPKITSARDVRITKVGQLLRRWKFDELPQLFNVIRGDMSLVGPRPDVPEYIASLSPRLINILCVRPGLTGMASLRYRNEETLLAGVKSSEVTGYYCTHVLPDKARVDLEYAKRAGFKSDLTILFHTLHAILN